MSPAAAAVNDNVVADRNCNNEGGDKQPPAEEQAGAGGPDLVSTFRPCYANLEPNFMDNTGGLHRDLVQDSISDLLHLNRKRIEAIDENFRVFLNPKSVEYLFTICLRLRLAPEIKYIALEIYNKFMVAHTKTLYETVQRTRTDLSAEQKASDWEKILTTISRQATLRTLSCIQIATKLHSFNSTLTVERIQLCLQLLGYAYTVESIRKSEIRVLMTVGWCGNVLQTPLIYVESFLNIIFHVNTHLDVDTHSIWEYSVLIVDCVFLRLEEFYDRIAMVAHGRQGKHAPKRRMNKVEADYALLAAGVIVTACICVHGTDFIGTLIIQLEKITGIPSESIRDFYTGIYQTIHEHKVDNPLIISSSLPQSNKNCSSSNERQDNGTGKNDNKVAKNLDAGGKKKKKLKFLTSTPIQYS